jgi:hypothetical protein
MSEEREPTADEADPQLSAQLAEQRPLPGAAFRGALGRLLSTQDPGYGPRPARLGLLVTVLVCAGVALVVVGALVALVS